MRIAVGSDHRGLALKKQVIELVQTGGHAVDDLGVYTEDRADYPLVARKVGQAVAEGRADRGILVCGTGIGMCIAANKVRDIRAAMAYNTFSACRARQHNDANVLCLGAENDQSQVPEMVNAFLTCDFEGGRHTDRVRMIREMESR